MGARLLFLLHTSVQLCTRIAVPTPSLPSCRNRGSGGLDDSGKYPLPTM